MRLLVTGASGLLGANVVEMLLFYGYEVNVLLRKTSNTIGLQGLKVNIRYGDLQDEESIRMAALDCRGIIHCAANTKQWNTSREEHDMVNLVGTKKIIQAAVRASVQRLVFVSTANTFPLLNEQPFPLDTPYVSSKKAAEDYVLNQDHVEAMVINPSFMIGARDAKPSSGQAVLHYLNQNPVFTPAGGKSFVHVKDVAEAVVKAFESPNHQKRFLLANDNRTYRSFFELTGEVTGKKKKLLTIPPLLSRTAGAVGSLYGKLTGSTPKLNLENALLINTKLYYNGEEAYRELGLGKRPLEEAVFDAVEWFRVQGYC
jgi:dihydroflavonol-4-reductase